MFLHCLPLHSQALATILILIASFTKPAFYKMKWIRFLLSFIFFETILSRRLSPHTLMATLN